MTSKSNNVYIDKLDEIVNKYNNTYHRTIKMTPVDVTSSTIIDFNKENNEEGPKFKVGEHVRISKYKNIFTKVWNCSYWSEETVPWTYVIIDFNDEEIVRTFYEIELQKTNQKQYGAETVRKRKGNKLHVKWKGCNNYFNS